MKKIFYVIVLSFCLIATPVVSYADYGNTNNNVIDGIPTIDDDFSDDKNLIAEGCLDNVRSWTNDTQVNEENIKYDKALKKYWEMPLFEENELELQNMQDFADKAFASYNIPVYYNNEQLCNLSVTKGIEVTDDMRNGNIYTEKEIESLERKSGRWHVSSISYDTEIFKNADSVYKLLDDYGIKNSYVYCVNSVGEYYKDVLVIFPEGSTTAEFIVIEGVDNSVLIPNTELGKRTYTYSELKELEASYAASKADRLDESFIGVGEYSSVNESNRNNNNLHYALIAGGAVLAVSAVAIIINFASKKKSKITE